MRVTIFGSGYGYVRSDQADQSIYVELGNGDTFMFDMGEGAEANYMMMQVPYSKMTNLFITHHHMNHLGSLPHLYTFGPSADRWTPMNGSVKLPADRRQCDDEQSTKLSRFSVFARDNQSHGSALPNASSVSY